MKLLHPELVEEYYKSIKKDHPTITLEQCNEICSAPFLEARNNIQSGELPTIRLKFFGTFVATPNMIKAMLKTYEKMFKEHRICPQNYFLKKNMLEKNLTKKEKHESKS